MPNKMIIISNFLLIFFFFSDMIKKIDFLNTMNQTIFAVLSKHIENNNNLACKLKLNIKKERMITSHRASQNVSFFTLTIFV